MQSEMGELPRNSGTTITPVVLSGLASWYSHTEDPQLSGLLAPSGASVWLGPAWLISVL